MGERGEIFNIKTFAQNGLKTYFFNVKENRYNDVFINIVESLRQDDTAFNRKQIVVFEADMAHFAVVLWNLQTALANDYGDDVGEVWREDLASKNAKRHYIFKIIRNKKGLQFGLIMELKEQIAKEDEFELENGFNTIKVEREDADVFVIGYNRARAWRDDGNAKINSPASIPLKYQVKNIAKSKKLVVRSKKPME